MPMRSGPMAAMLMALVTAAPAATSQGGARGEFVITTLAERRTDHLPPGPLYWRIESFATGAAARSAEGPYALAASPSGRHWLFTLGPARGRTPGGRPVAELGPVSIPVARSYLLRINRAGGPPAAATPVHTHPGSEAIYVLRGRVTQRTSHGVRHAKAGETLRAHLPDMPMQLASSGTTDLEQLVMFVVDADRPFSPPARF